MIISAQPPVGSIWNYSYYFAIIIGFTFIYAARLPIRGGSRSTYSKGGNVKEVRFEDVGGCLEAKEELMEIVDFLKNPKIHSFRRLKLPKECCL